MTTRVGRGSLPHLAKCYLAPAWPLRSLGNVIAPLTFGEHSITGDAGPNQLRGGLGDDIIRGLDGNDVLAGEAGTDHLDGGLGANLNDGGSGTDT